MPTYASISPSSNVDGILYADNTPITSTEADLCTMGTIPNLDPLPVLYGQAAVAIVELSVSGNPAGNSTYVVMQTDFGDGVWIDVAWCFYNETQSAGTFVLCGGGVGSINNAFRQTRQSGSVPNPQANGSNAMPLGGRIRFVGKSVFTGGSSYVAGAFVGVYATIRVKVLGN